MDGLITYLFLVRRNNLFLEEVATREGVLLTLALAEEQVLPGICHFGHCQKPAGASHCEDLAQ